VGRRGTHRVGCGNHCVSCFSQQLCEEVVQHLRRCACNRDGVVGVGAREGSSPPPAGCCHAGRWAAAAAGRRPPLRRPPGRSQETLGKRGTAQGGGGRHLRKRRPGSDTPPLRACCASAPPRHPSPPAAQRGAPAAAVGGQCSHRVWALPGQQAWPATTHASHPSDNAMPAAAAAVTTHHLTPHHAGVDDGVVSPAAAGGAAHGSWPGSCAMQAGAPAAGSLCGCRCARRQGTRSARSSLPVDAGQQRLHLTSCTSLDRGSNDCGRLAYVIA